MKEEKTFLFNTVFIHPFFFLNFGGVGVNTFLIKIYFNNINSFSLDIFRTEEHGLDPLIISNLPVYFLYMCKIIWTQKYTWNIQNENMQNLPCKSHITLKLYKNLIYGIICIAGSHIPLNLKPKNYT